MLIKVIMVVFAVPQSNFTSWSTVPSSYNCTHVCDFLHGTTRFYSVSESNSMHGLGPRPLMVLSMVTSMITHV